MRKSALTIIILFVTVFSISAKHKKHKLQKPQTAVSDIQSIYMHRTGCFGKCPDYIVEIKSDGTVKYSGVNFVKDSGVYEKHFSTKSVKKFFDEFSQYKPDTCQETYPNKIPDLPGLIYKITYKDKIKNIHNAHWGPLFLRTFSSSIDSFAQVNNSWKKLPETIKR